MLHSSVTSLKTTLVANDASKLVGELKLAGVGLNSFAANGKAWIGKDGPYVNEFFNDSGEDIILVLWGDQASWVNAHVPYITHSLPAATSISISLAEGTTGGYTAIYGDTKMSEWGQLSNTWGEYTTKGSDTTFDVTRIVDMNGHDMKIETPTCVSDMSHCVFQCAEGEASCYMNYSLIDCPSNSGIDPTNGGASGGCKGFDGTSGGTIRTTFY